MRIEVTLWRKLLDTVGERLAFEWAEFAALLLGRPGPFLADEHPGWSPGTFVGERRGKGNVERLWCLVFDIDGTKTIGWALDVFAGRLGLLHTSKSHTPERHRYRVVLPLARPVTAAEHDAMWRRFNHRWPNAFDDGAKDASRFWYRPALGASRLYETRELEGPPLDPDDVLSWPEPPTAREPVSPPKPIDQRDGERPGEAFARSTSWAQILEPHSWTKIGTRGDSTHWCRPGKTAGTSATTGGEGDWLYVFSSNAQPFEANEHYTKFAAFAALECGGDMGAAAKKLGADGFGEQRKPRQQADPADLPPEAFDQDDWYPPPEAPPRAPEPEPATERPWERFGAATMYRMLRSIADRPLSSGPVPRVSTCSIELDRIMRGFRRGHITTLGAVTSWGKSSWSLMVADEAQKDGKRALIVSTEDPESTYATRLAARRCKLNATKVDDNDLTEQQRIQIGVAADRAPDLPFFLSAIGKPIEWIAQALDVILRHGDYDLAILDYLQAAGCDKKTQDRRNEVTYAARTFADVVKACNCSGLVLSQIKRLERPGLRPTMHDLKESGDIENMSEHILIGYTEGGKDSRDGTNEEKRFLSLEKNKDGQKSRDGIFLPYEYGTASFIRAKEGAGGW